MTDTTALFESAMLHLNNGDRAAACRQLEQVLEIDPDHVQAWNNRGLALLGLGHPFDCIIHMDRALAISPEAEQYNNRGAAWLEKGFVERALADFDRALAIKRFEHVFLNRGNALSQLGRFQESKAAYREAIRMNPDYVDAHLNLAFLELADGNFEWGWKGYEWRWRSPQMVQRGLPIPVWEGEKTEDPENGLLLYGEQGMGDALQFVRYGPPAKEAWGGKVYIEVRSPLTRFVKTLKGVDGIVTYGEELPPGITRCLPLMTCPMVLGTRVETIPAEVPYLYADPARVALWQGRLNALPGDFSRRYLVGACWAGMSRAHQPVAAAVDARRSTALSDWAPLAAVPGVTWVSLQKGPPAEQIKRPPAGMSIVDWSEELDDWCDTAALISCLDLVVTVDTAVAHAAGALGKPVWLLSRYDGCWRWMGHRPTSPWYPSMRLFHQPKPNDWAAPTAEAARALSALSRQHAQRAA